MITFSLWTHPATNQQRIYISGLLGQKTSKVFVTRTPVDSFGFEYDITAQIPDGVYVRSADLLNEAERAINEAAGSRVKTFGEVLALAKN